MSPEESRPAPGDPKRPLGEAPGTGGIGTVPPGAERGSSFYLGFLFLPKRKREALGVVYAYCRLIDDIVDSGALTSEEASKQLEFWRAEVGRLYEAEAEPEHSLGRRLKPFVGEFRLPKEAFLEIIRGVEMDLEKSRYETFEELERYLFGVAGAVGLLCVEIFGYKHTSPEKIREYAVAMGNAFQLTNIMRDVGADLEQGRIYLPLEDIREAGSSEEEVALRKHTAAFSALMSREYERAKEFYRRARGLLHPGDRRSMLPAEVMARIYEGTLERMRDEQFRVFFRRVSLPMWRKGLLALKTWASYRG